jgi:hypothetical protein
LILESNSTIRKFRNTGDEKEKSRSTSQLDIGGRGIGNQQSEVRKQKRYNLNADESN